MRPFHCLAVGLLAALGIAASGSKEAVAQSYAVQYSFNGRTDGGRPTGIVADADGDEYGMTQLGGQDCPLPQSQGADGCGAIYKRFASGAFHVLLTFDGANGANGTPPSKLGIGNAAPLVLRQRTLYGATPYGGPANLGVVFSIKTDGSDFTILHAFSGLDGATPFGTLAVDKEGDVFGTTAYGGTNYTQGQSGNGVLYEIPASDSFTVLYDFTDGGTANPSGVILDRFSTVFGGSLNLTGTGSIYSIWRYVPATKIFSTIISNTGGGAIISAADRSDNLFGYIQGSGGAFGGGILKALDGKTGYSYQSLHAFSGHGDGINPSGLTLSSGGVLTGVTYYGPFPDKNDPQILGYGTIFRYTGGSLSTLYQFPGTTPGEGRNPSGSPAITAAGAIESSTAYGSSPCSLTGEKRPGCGVLFTFSP